MCDYNQYIRVVKYQNLMMDFELSFKNNKVYQQILEHTPGYRAELYLKAIKEEFSSFYNNNKNILIELCNKNDYYGKPEKIKISDFTVCSPSNLKYIYHSLLILNNIISKKLNNVDIIEIGGGYGGLCFFIYNISKLFNVAINSYTIFDIKEVTILQKRYLKLLDINIETYDIKDDWKLNKNSYLISNSAFSEISKDLQEEYSEKVLNNYVSNGFLVWNFIPVYQFIKDKQFIIESERPCGDSLNKFVYIN
jgi:hypothetical protein